MLKDFTSILFNNFVTIIFFIDNYNAFLFSVNKNFFVKEMLKNEHNILFEHLSPSDVPGPIFDVLKQLYPNNTDRIDKLPKHIVNRKYFWSYKLL